MEILGFLKFGDMRWFGLLILVPLVWVLLSIIFKKARAQTKEFANPEIVSSASRFPSPRSEIRKRIVIAFILIFTICFFTKPQYYGFDTILLREQVGIVNCLDISRSMTAEEAHFGKGGRLGAAKREIEDFVNQLFPGYRIGLLLFSGNILENIPPLTPEYEDFLRNVREADPNWISDQGTNIEWAIKKAVDMFDDEAKIRIIIFVSDGEREGGQDIIPGAVEHAKKNKVKIYTIGVGKEEASIPDPVKEGDFLKDEQGNHVKTKPDEGMLRDIAEATGGSYASYDEKEKLVKILNQIIKEAEVSSRVKVPQWKDLSRWFLLVAFILALLMLLII